MHTSGSALVKPSGVRPSPLVGEGGAKRRMRGRVTSPRRSPSRRGDLPDRSPDPSSALRAPSPARGRRGQSGDSAALSAGLPLARFSAGELHEKGICPLSPLRPAALQSHRRRMGFARCVHAVAATWRRKSRPAVAVAHGGAILRFARHGFSRRHSGRSVSGDPEPVCLALAGQSGAHRFRVRLRRPGMTMLEAPRRRRASAEHPSKERPTRTHPDLRVIDTTIRMGCPASRAFKAGSARAARWLAGFH